VITCRSFPRTTWTAKAKHKYVKPVEALVRNSATEHTFRLAAVYREVNRSRSCGPRKRLCFFKALTVEAVEVQRFQCNEQS
jgi:hypothetical protein